MTASVRSPRVTPRVARTPRANPPALKTEVRLAAPKSGDILHISKRASVQFVNPFYFRVIRVLDWPTYDGWVWVDGYQLNPTGDAVARRSLYVQKHGLRFVVKPK